MKAGEIPTAEALLREGERWCMNACGRYMSRGELGGDVWTLRDGRGRGMAAVVVHAGRGLLPVRRFAGLPLPEPHFVRGLFDRPSVHSLQGRTADVFEMEKGLGKMGLPAGRRVDFDVMCIDRKPGGFEADAPAGVAIRGARTSDMETLVALQAAYEEEEVLDEERKPNLAACRLRVERLLAREQVFVAELDGGLVGKINTSAATFTRYQVGGVYVLPEFRGRGIARRMAGEFVSLLVAQGRGVSLFVKKSNPSARAVYARLGFAVAGDYRINYYRQ